MDLRWFIDSYGRSRHGPGRVGRARLRPRRRRLHVFPDAQPGGVPERQPERAAVPGLHLSAPGRASRARRTAGVTAITITATGAIAVEWSRSRASTGAATTTPRSGLTARTAASPPAAARTAAGPSPSSTAQAPAT